MPEKGFMLCRGEGCPVCMVNTCKRFTTKGNDSSKYFCVSPIEHSPRGEKYCEMRIQVFKEEQGDLFEGF